MRTLTKTAIGIITVISMLLQTALPVNAKKLPCCSCCADAVCKCGCNKISSSEQNVQSPRKNGAADTCDFDKCNEAARASNSITFIVTSNGDSSKKKLVLGPWSRVLAETKCLFSIICLNNAYDEQLFLPPPLFLKNSCLLL